MKFVLITAISLLSFAANAGLLSNLVGSEPDFVKNHFIDRPFSEMNSNFHKGVQDETCPSSNAKECQAKFGKACTCKRVILNSSRLGSEVVYAVIVDGKVVEYNNIFNPFNPITAPTVRSFFGDDAPNVIYETDGQRNYQGYFAVWNLKEGSAAVSALCRMTFVAGAKKMEKSLRECQIEQAEISRYHIFGANPEKLKKVDVNY